MHEPTCDYIVTPEETQNHVGKCGPHVLIIGAMKCGTNNVAHHLTQHTQVTATKVSEIHAFSRFLKDDQSLEARQKYADFFLDTDGTSNFTYDKSPSYLTSEGAASAAKKLLPNARVLVTLCDPTERLYSQYQHEKRIEKQEAKWQQQTFAEWVAKTEHINYAENLATWQKAFGRDAVHVTFLEHFVAEHTEWMKEMLEFIGVDLNKMNWEEFEESASVPTYHNPEYKGRSISWTEEPQVMQQLVEEYRGQQEALAKLLDYSDHGVLSSWLRPKAEPVKKALMSNDIYPAHLSKTY